MAQWSPALATLIDAMLTALSQAIPARIPAGSRNDVGGVKVFSAPTNPQRWYHSASCSGGSGALPYRDGVCGMKSLNHGDSKILPAEVIEATDPILIEEEALASDSGGAGKFRGGLGTTRTFRVLQDGIGAFSMHRATCPPWGLFGGAPAAGHVPLPDSRPRAIQRAEAGERPAAHRLGGAHGNGGRRRLGQPARPRPAFIALDVRRGYVPAAAAREQYGVALTPAGEPDTAATAALRAQRR